jgi:hypothetical protein
MLSVTRHDRFDTDILMEILVGAPEFVTRASNIPRHEQAVPVVVIEEIIRGRLQVIRQAEASTARVDLARAYALFEQTIRDVQRLTSVCWTHHCAGSKNQKSHGLHA